MASSPTSAGTPAAAGMQLTPIRLRLTGNMKMLGLILALMMVAAVNYQSNAAWGLVMALVAILALSALHARRNLAGICVMDGVCEDGFAQDAATATLRLYADGAADGIDIGLSVPSWNSSVARVPLLAARCPVGVQVALPPGSRGIHRAFTVRLVTRFPFGLIEASREQPLDLKRVIYPRPHGDAAAAAGDAAIGGANDRLVAVDALGSDDFLGHRRYHDGEAQRQVDWKAYARGAPLLVKRFAGASGPSIWCDWQRTSGAYEQRLSQMSKWLVDAHASGASIGMRLHDVLIQPRRGDAHLKICLQLLAAQPAEAS
jgi:uncharacterized protein (DUF58 family)